MTINFPGPYDIRIFYHTAPSGATSLAHVQKLNVVCASDPDVGTPFADIDLILPDGVTTIPAATAVDNWVLDFKAMLGSGTGNSIDHAELWKYATESFDASFVSSYDISVAGTSGSAVQNSVQSIVTMRTDGGGIFRLNFFETVIAMNVTDAGTFTNANLESMVADIEAGLYPWLGRDGFYPHTRIAHYPGQNERLFRKRFRGA